MSIIILPRRYRSQPQERAVLDPSSPVFAGVTNALILYGNHSYWRRNAAADLGSGIGTPTLNGTVASDITEVGTAIALNGTNAYIEVPAANVPTSEFTLFFGVVFDDNDSPRGLADCTTNGVSGWNIYQNGSDGMYFNNSSYPTSNGTTGWTVGKFWHGALRNKGGVSCDWFRNGAKIYTGSGVSPAAPTVPLWIGRLKVGATPYLNGRFSYLYLVDRYHSHDTICNVAINPNIVFAAKRRVIQFASAAPPASTSIPVFAHHYRQQGIM